MSFGRSLPNIKSVLCPMQITSTGLSIKDVNNMREGVKDKQIPLITTSRIVNRNLVIGEGGHELPTNSDAFMHGPKQN